MGEGEGAPKWGLDLLACKPLRLSELECRALEASVGGTLASASDKLFGVQVSRCASPVEQALALINMSSDANILVRQYFGLSPWV